MAFVNPNKPSGLSPVATLSGSDWTGKGRVYCIPSTESTYNYFPGDLVGLQSGAGGDSNGIPYIALCQAGTNTLNTGAANGTAVGVIQSIGTSASGPWINPNNLATTYAPITKLVNYYAYVLDDPNIIYEIQEGSSTASTNLTGATGCGFNAQIAIPSASTTAAPTNYVSQMYLDNHVAPAATIYFNLKILQFVQRADNHFVTSPATGGGAQKWWVLINNHQYRAGVTGA